MKNPSLLQRSSRTQVTDSCEATTAGNQLVVQRLLAPLTTTRLLNPRPSEVVLYHAAILDWTCALQRCLNLPESFCHFGHLGPGRPLAPNLVLVLALHVTAVGHLCYRQRPGLDGGCARQSSLAAGGNAAVFPKSSSSSSSSSKTSRQFGLKTTAFILNEGSLSTKALIRRQSVSNTRHSQYVRLLHFRPYLMLP